MGDQAKEIARGILRLAEKAKVSQPDELQQMGEIAVGMLNQVLDAYVENNPSLAETIAKQDREVDDLYTFVFSHIIENMVEAKKQKRILEAYELLRVAQKLERVGDLATNIAERVIYITTGKLEEINVEPDDNLK